MTIFAAFTNAYRTAQSAGVFEPLQREIGGAMNLWWPNAWPPVDDVVAAFRAGLIENPDESALAILCGGAYPPAENFNAENARAGGVNVMGERMRMWQAVHKLEVGMPTMGDLLSLKGKGYLSDEGFERSAKRQGWWETQFLTQAQVAYETKYPTPTDLVTFAIREVWDPVTVQRFQYDAEFPAPFKHFMRQLGFDSLANVDRVITPENPAVTWSEMYWRAHWRVVSPTQAYEMYQRLRPNRIARFGADFAGIRAFTIGDLRQILRVDDYPPPFRDQLGAIAYRRPRLVDIDRFFAIGSIDAAEVYELHLDLGYSPADARLRTDWLIKRKTMFPSSPAAKALPRRIVQLYTLGRLNRNQAEERLLDALSGGTYQRWNVAPQAEGEARAWRDFKNEATRQLDSADLADQARSAQALLKAYRKQYLQGQLNANELGEEMSNAGFDATFARRFALRLDAELASGRMMLSTERIRRLVIQGILPMGVATQYLLNLGWKEPEIGYLLAQLKRDLGIEQDKAEEQLARDKQTREQAQLRQAAAHGRERDRLIKRLNRQASKADLRKWFIRGILAEDEYDRELQRRGFVDAVRKNMLQEAWIERRKYYAKRRDRAAAIDQRNETFEWGPATSPVPPA